MRILALVGAQPNQVALCHRLHQMFGLAAIVFSENVPRKRPSPLARVRRVSRSIAGRGVGRRLTGAWFAMQAEYATRYAVPSGPRTLRVRNVNDAATIELIHDIRPELAIVSGTNLVGRRTLDHLSDAIGVLNLHTGISPYVKGGPNCTNWCLSEGLFHLIGNTVMWLDAGIDSGPLIATERTGLCGDETLLELHWRVMEHAHDLYLRAVGRLVAGSPVPHVDQKAIAAGRTFCTAQWGARAMHRAVRRFDREYRRAFADRDSMATLLRGVRLVGLEQQ